MIEPLKHLLRQLEELRMRAIAALESIQTSAELDEWDIRYLGRNRGELKSISAIMPKLTKEERPTIGQKINTVKSDLERLLATRREALKQRELLQAMERERIDVTLPGRTLPPG